MKKFCTTLLAALFTVSLIHASAAQDPIGSPQKSATRSADARRKGEVEVMYDELKKRGEDVVLFDGGAQSKKNNIPKGVVNGSATDLVTPNYPAVARASHVSGMVSILVIIDPAGKVIAAQPSEGDSLLHPAALKAARESRFKPTLVDGKAVHVLGKVIYNFVTTTR